MIHDSIQIGPICKFTLPMRKSRERSNDQIGSWEMLLYCQMVDEGNSLNCFAQAHFVGQHRVTPLVPIEKHPVHTCELILPEHKLLFFLEWRRTRCRVTFKIHSTIFLPRLRILKIVDLLVPFCSTDQTLIVKPYSIIIVDIIFAFPSQLIIRQSFPFHQEIPKLLHKIFIRWSEIVARAILNIQNPIHDTKFRAKIFITALQVFIVQPHELFLTETLDLAFGVLVDLQK